MVNTGIGYNRDIEGFTRPGRSQEQIRAELAFRAGIMAGGVAVEAETIVLEAEEAEAVNA